MEKESLGFEPLKVTITVVSARQLQGKKKGELCRASVVFGLGKELFQTEEIESNEPFWNQEAHVHVTGKTNESLSFKLKDQGHTIGIITIPVLSLTRRKQEKWIPFQPYKKEKESHGELCLSCFVSEFRPLLDSSPTNSHSSTEDISHGNKKGLFHRHNHSSGSDIELKHQVNPSSSSPINRQSEDDTHSRESSIENESHATPEVSGVSPSEGSVDGQERVTLRGTNLGESRADIIRVVLVDIDCTSTVEYFSSGKLIVTTLPRHTPGSGPVIVETISGGVGVSSLHYTYVSRSPSDRTKHELLASPQSGQRKPKLSDHEISELQAENRSIKQQVRELKESNNELHEENVALKAYVERLLSAIIAHNPELLEVAQQM